MKRKTARVMPRTAATALSALVAHQVESMLRPRVPGRRVKHRMKQNWLKMYEKAGWILRVETVINNPEEFRVRRRVRRRSRRRTEWVPLRKSVAYIFRYREISLQSNSRYLKLRERHFPALYAEAA